MILLLLVGMVFSQPLTKEDRLNSIKDIRLAMSLCGYSSSNTALFKKQIVQENDTQKLNCLISKAVEVENVATRQNERVLRIENTKNLIAEYDCSSLSAFEKLLCEYYKEKLSN